MSDGSDKTEIISGEDSPPIPQVEVKVVEAGGVKMMAEVLSSTDYEPKILDVFEIKWETNLTLEPGKQYISSREYFMDFETEDESCWRFDLDPNYMGQDGVRYLSFYLVLVKTRKEDAEITAKFDVFLPATGTGLNAYSKLSGLSKFSKETPCRGFEQYIPYNQLGPYGKPNSTEKLEIFVLINMLKDGPTSPEDIVGSVPSSPSPFDNMPLEYDAYVRFGNDVLSVASARLSHHTGYFRKYFVQSAAAINNETPDLSSDFPSKAMLLKVITFCHKGQINMPPRWNGLRNLLEIAAKLEMAQLQDLLQDEILTNCLNVRTFTKVVDVVKDHLLERKVAYPTVYEFMIANIGELIKNDDYKRTYVDNQSFYEELLRTCEKPVKKYPPDPWVEGYNRSYLNNPT